MSQALPPRPADLPAKPPSGSGCLVNTLCAVGVSLASLALRSAYAMKLWAWFVTPLWPAAPALGFFDTAGLLSLGLVAFRVVSTEPDDGEPATPRYFLRRAAVTAGLLTFTFAVAAGIAALR